MHRVSKSPSRTLLILTVVLAASLVACSPGEAPTPMSSGDNVTATHTAVPTNTPKPLPTATPTATPTNTPVPTATPVPTPTSTPTPTATATPTATTVPPTRSVLRTPTSAPTQAPPSGQGVVPGQTICDPTLQQDVLWYVMLYEEIFGGDCVDSKVVDTQVIEPPVENKWVERWTVDRCGALIHYRVEFIGSPGGGTSFSVGLVTG